MPDEITTPAPTTPAAAPTAPATPPAETPPANPTYNADGKVDIKEEEFLSEDETKTELPVDQTPTPPAPPATETPEEKVAREAQEVADAAAETERLAKETTETGKAKPGDETLLAGKYKTQEELAAAFTELGGDPTKYTTPEALVEAYGVRNAEFTRVRQEQDEVKRISDAAEAKRVSDAAAAEQDPENITAKILGGLKMEEINNVEDMVKQLVPLLVANLPKPQAALDEAELAAKLEPQIRARGERIQALATLETEVPRLKTDMVFRKGFATHLTAGNYERSEAGLKQAMQDFLGLGKTIAEESKAQSEKSEAAKGAAVPPTEAGTPTATPPAKGSPEDDILSEIINAHDDHEAKISGGA